MAAHERLKFVPCAFQVRVDHARHRLLFAGYFAGLPFGIAFSSFSSIGFIIFSFFSAAFFTSPFFMPSFFI